MCGIVTLYSTTEKPVSTKLLTQMYVRQRNRGKDGYGFSYLDASGRIRVRRFEHEAECFLELGRVSSRLIQLHHRFPTSTKNNPLQNHPITCETDTHFYSLIHNGVIQQPHAAKARHELYGVRYSTWREESKDFNDSECLLHDLVKQVEADVPVSVTGSMAFVLLQCGKDRKLQSVYFGRNTSPLYWQDQLNGTFSLSSESDLTFKDNLDSDTLYRLKWPSLEATQVECELKSYVYTPPAPKNQWPNSYDELDGQQTMDMTGFGDVGTQEDACLWAKMVLDDCEGEKRAAAYIPMAERLGLLGLIDETVRSLSPLRTRRAKKLRAALIEQRVRFVLPQNAPDWFSRFMTKPAPLLPITSQRPDPLSSGG